MDLKTRVERYLEETGETQREFAARAGMHESQLSRYVNGINAPRPAALVRLLEAFGARPSKRVRPPALADFVLLDEALLAQRKKNRS